MQKDNRADGNAVSGTEEKLINPYYEKKVFDFGDYYSTLRKSWKKVVLLSFAAGVVALIVTLRSPNIYRATAVITPVGEESKFTPAIGALASFGVDIGGLNKVEDLDTLFKSKDLTVRVFETHNLWPIILEDRYDSSTGTVKISWMDRLIAGDKKPRAPVDWDAIRIMKDRLVVSTNKKSNTVTISFDSTSAEGSANIVRHYLEDGKNRLQEEALGRARNNKKFIEEQIGRTVDALTRDRLYSLYGQEVEREMMARNREQFGFRIIDTPRIPDRKIKPQRVKAAVMASTLAFFLGWFAFVCFDKKNNKERDN